MLKCFLILILFLPHFSEEKLRMETQPFLFSEEKKSLAKRKEPWLRNIYFKLRMGVEPT